MIGPGETEDGVSYLMSAEPVFDSRSKGTPPQREETS